MENTNKPAFPIINSDGYATNFQLLEGEDAGAIGLTKREYFAVLAMQGLISSCDWNVSVFGESLVEATSKNAVELADELLKQLENKK